MREIINEKISVVSIYSSKKRCFVPYSLSWQNRDYKIGKIGFRHQIKNGNTLHHIFECVDNQNTVWFRLNLDTKNLSWTLEVVSDGLAE